MDNLKNKSLWAFLGSVTPLVVSANTYPPVCIPPSTQILGDVITNHPHPDAVYLEADRGEIKRRGISQLDGKVIIQRNQQRLNAEQASYNQQTKQVTASGNVTLSAPNTHFQSDRIHYNLAKQAGTIENAQYQLPGTHTHGKSQRIIQHNAEELELQGASYTTCPIMDPSWHLASSSIKLNHKTQTGSAQNVTLRVGDIPIFYFPWLNFSLNNQRKSGFLSPKAGISDQSGYELTIPYYFNLAPNYDATLSVTQLSKRGWKLDSELRFKTEDGEGALNYQFLPSDKAFNKQWRDYFKLGYTHTLSPRSKLTLNAEGVSDRQYFHDLSDSLVLSTTSALAREIRYSVTGDYWDFSLSALDHQVLDTSSQPYAKLPELKFKYQSPHRYNQLDFAIDAEATYFDKTTSTTGLRIDVGLSASKRFGNQAWYLIPTTEYRLTQYNLQNGTHGNTHSRALPSFSLDGGLFFEKTLKNGLTQTLEPRFFYTYTPYKDQSQLPTFDTSLTDFSTNTQLFETNRYTGKDRIGDTNQLTLALTTRLQDPKTGQETTEASIGQVFYFDDRKVTLPGETLPTGRSSALAVEVKRRLTDTTRLSSTWLWDPSQNDWASEEIRVNYQDEKKRIANISYQHLKGELSEVDGSFSLPLNQKWSMVGRADYDLFNHRSLELLAGLEYRDCCWGARAVARRYLTSDNVTYDDALYFELELKGLGSVGNSARSILQEKTYGYE